MNLSHLTIVIPTYNEAENLPGLISALFALPLPEVHILIVDDNSPDGTGEIADRLAQESDGKLSVIHRSGKLGFGSANIQGFRQAISNGAEAICQMDADFSHPPELLPVMVAGLAECDLLMGSRYISGGGVDRRWPLWRKGLSAFGNLYARLILNVPIKDITGGYRLWRSYALQRIPLERVRSNGYAFQIEMAYLAHRLGYSIREVPFYFADRTRGGSKMSFGIQVEAAVRVWQMRIDYRDVKPIRD